MNDMGNTEPGSTVVPDGMACPMCGATIAAQSRRCPACGESLAAGERAKKSPISLVTVVTVLGIGVVVVALLLPSVRSAREPARRTQCMNNLHNIALALHNYEAAYGALPPAYTVDANGKPLHSWRTLILPYLDEKRVYEKIDLSKSWDDPVNAEAAKTVLSIYHCPSDLSPPNYTTYFASVAPNGCFRLTDHRRLSEITDGLSETLLVIEVPSDQSVPWMSPQDADESLVMSIGPDSKLVHTSGFNVAFCDGRARYFSADTPAATRRAIISIAGGDKVGDY